MIIFYRIEYKKFMSKIKKIEKRIAYESQSIMDVIFKNYPL